MNVSLLLLLALIQVESGGRPNAIGDNGQAVGILQIHPIMVEDCNRISGKHYTLADRLDPVKSCEIASLYLKRYSTAEKAKNDIDLSKLWNGGPAGMKNNNTIEYSRRVIQAEKEIARRFDKTPTFFIL